MGPWGPWAGERESQNGGKSRFQRTKSTLVGQGGGGILCCAYEPGDWPKKWTKTPKYCSLGSILAALVSPPAEPPGQGYGPQEENNSEGTIFERVTATPYPWANLPPPGGRGGGQKRPWVPKISCPSHCTSATRATYHGDAIDAIDAAPGHHSAVDRARIMYKTSKPMVMVTHTLKMLLLGLTHHPSAAFLGPSQVEHKCCIAHSDIAQTYVNPYLPVNFRVFPSASRADILHFCRAAPVRAGSKTGTISQTANKVLESAPILVIRTSFDGEWAILISYLQPKHLKVVIRVGNCVEKNKTVVGHISL